MFIKKLLVILAFWVYVCCENNTPVVKTPLGRVKGYYRAAYAGRTFSAFEGIPYAKPPIGKRRFQEPEPFEPWTGTWDASFLTQCVQTNMVKQTTIEGEEDCLYINVYVPRQNPNPQEKLDVIVHIHGGGFMSGSGHSYAHPEFLMDKDIVFVTFNYRLGIFGFLSTEDDVVPGNNGLKDQVLALKWIQKNIGSFGGNPNSVTLNGLSAGASSVHFHYLSNMSKGLFHRGVSQSGVALNSWSIQENPLARSRILANAVGCSSHESQDFIQCLKQRHYRHLITKMPLFFGFKFLPFAPFAPVVEKGTNPFLDKSPFEILTNGQINDLPWIVSNTAHEGMNPAAYLVKDLKYIDENWLNVAHFLLDYNYTLSESRQENVAASIKKFYFGEENINTDTFASFVQLFSDRLFCVDTETSVKLQAEVNKSPVYYYRFGYPGDHSQNQTVAHGDDGQYIFFNMFQRKNISPNELKMKDVMVDTLVSFAKTGKPVIEGLTWEPTGYEELKYLKIDGFDTKAMKVEVKKESASTKFWKSLGFKENKNLLQIRDEL